MRFRGWEVQAPRLNINCVNYVGDVLRSHSARVEIAPARLNVYAIQRDLTQDHDRPKIIHPEVVVQSQGVV